MHGNKHLNHRHLVGHMHGEMNSSACSMRILRVIYNNNNELRMKEILNTLNSIRELNSVSLYVHRATYIDWKHSHTLCANGLCALLALTLSSARLSDGLG